jgi:hypothetical protein
LGKDKKYILAALKYCTSKSGHNYIFKLVLIVLVAILIVWSYWLEPMIFGKDPGYHGLLGSVVFGLLSYIFLLIDINTLTLQAVKRYIKEFENEQKQ